MILPAPFGYEPEYVYAETIDGKRHRIPSKLVPIKRPHEPVFLEWQADVEGLTADTCLVCGYDRYDEMHTLDFFANGDRY